MDVFCFLLLQCVLVSDRFFSEFECFLYSNTVTKSGYALKFGNNLISDTGFISIGAMLLI